MTTNRSVLTAFVIAGFASTPPVRSAETSLRAIPLVRAHAHNDYAHARPLFDALNHGFCGFEADIHLVDGKLLVAHDRDQVSEERTLESLYLNPLLEFSKANGGRVFREGPPVTLLIDIKSRAEPTYLVLRKLLSEYSSMLTAFETDGVRENAVTVIISGNRPRKIMETETLRFAAVDGRANDLGGGSSNRLIPLISDNWSHLFRWRGLGEFSEVEQSKLGDFVRQAHDEGRRIRFWNIPDRPEVWKELLDAGVDLINTDNLEGLKMFLLAEFDEKH